MRKTEGAGADKRSVADRFVGATMSVVADHVDFEWYSDNQLIGLQADLQRQFIRLFNELGVAVPGPGAAA